MVAALIDELMRIGQEAVARDLVVGSGGNLSARRPGSDEILVTASGTWLDRLDDRCFAAVSLANGPDPQAPVRPTSELALHLAAYRARPEINAVIHLHPQATVLLDAMGERVRLITTDHAFYVRRIASTPVLRPGTAEVGLAAARALADGTNCLILPHHGCCVVGADLDLAWRRAVNLEEAARMTYRALLITGGLPGRGIVECPIEFEDTDTV